MQNNSEFIDDNERSDVRRRPSLAKIAVVYAKIVAGTLSKAASKAIPKNKKVVLVVPRFGSSFSGNLKYVFLHLSQEAHKHDIEVYCIIKKGKLCNQLRESGLPVIHHYSVKSIWLLLRADKVLVESTKWGKKLKSALAYKSKKYQIWHGNGMKEVAMSNPLTAINMSDPYKVKLFEALDSYPVYDYMFFSSNSQAKTRASSFKFKKYLINGQPRNDVVFGKSFEHQHLGADEDTLREIIKAKEKGMAIVMYSPTWRPKEDVQPGHAIDVYALEKFCVCNNVFFIYKAHPKEKFSFPALENVVVYHKDRDIYPAFQYVDVMITDYSSIYMDYLLLDRPVLFFPYDEELYISKRGLQYDYSEVTPGKKCYTQLELQSEILRILSEGDEVYKCERREVVEKFNEYVDGNSCERLVNYILST